jgi:LmbE family N-acetylglucosaminyl deacetylase
MKPTPNSSELPPLLAFGAHPDDIEFGCGGVVASETQAGRKVHFVVCSRGEAGTYGTPKERVAEAEKSAGLLGATIEFIELDGDAHLEQRTDSTPRKRKVFASAFLKRCILLVPVLPRKWEEFPKSFRTR